MLITEPPGDEHAFFEIAATLIPLLLFGGVLIERAKPPPAGGWKPQHEPVALVLVIFGAIALVAEALAIEAVVTGEASEPIRILVAFVLVGAMASVVAAISSPWLSRLKRSSYASYRWVVPLSGTVLLGAAMVSLGVLVAGTNFADRKERLDAYEKALAENLAEQDAVRRNLDSLSLEMSRLDSRLAIAAGHRDVVAVKALTAEIKSLNLRTRLASERETFLFRKGVDLEREARGEAPLPRNVLPP